MVDAAGSEPSGEAPPPATGSQPQVHRVASDERRDRRRVNSLLKGYYGIDAANDPSSAPAAGISELDREGFDAKNYFDKLVSTGKIADILKVANDVCLEVRDLDGDSQMVTYENYSKFIRATDVTKQMKTTIDGMDPDLRKLETGLGQIAEDYRRIEHSVAGRAQQIEALLKQQRLCKKLKVLFNLPHTLQSCLDRGAYGQAAKAYCCCVPFLRQYEHVRSFRSVLDDVELHMGRVRTALEKQLRSSELSVAEAITGAVTLLDLGEDRDKVVSEYLTGRAAALQASLDSCFASEPPVEDAAAAGEVLRRACAAATEQYLPSLCDSVEGFQQLPAGRSEIGVNAASRGEEALGEFVKAMVDDLCNRIARVIQNCCPPTAVLVSCMHSLREALRRIHSLLPRLLTKLFTVFLSRTTQLAVKSLFATAAQGLVTDLVKLHGACRSLSDSKLVNVDALMEEITSTQRSMTSRGSAALKESSALFDLLGSDQIARQQLARSLHEQLTAFAWTFVGVCSVHLGKDPAELHAMDASLVLSGPVVIADLDAIARLELSGPFGLALVCLGRQLDDKVIPSLWAEASELAGGDASPSSAQGLTSPAAGLVAELRSTVEAVITHYVLVSGQRLAFLFRNAIPIQRAKWMSTAKEPREPSMVIGMVRKEALAFDEQLGKILGDQRKARASGHQRRMFSRNKNSMELEMERQLAKTLQVFAPIALSRSSAIMGILRIAFKALYEYMREETFSKFGLQQVQVDCALLAEVSRDLVEAEDAGLLDSLLGEVVNSAAQRCMEPVLMEEMLLETICDEQKKKFKD